MLNQEKRGKSYILLAVIVLVCSAFFKAHDLYQAKKQANLQSVVKSIAQNEIKEVIIFRQDNERPLKLTPAQVNRFGNYLLYVNNDLIEGHNTPVCEFDIIITTEDNNKYKFLASINEKDINDLYLSNNFYYKSGDDAFERSFSLPVKIPRAGKFLYRNILAVEDVSNK